MKKVLSGIFFMLSAILAMAQTRELSGTVKDAVNNPVVGATVKVVGKPNVTSTDANGNFSFSVPAGALKLEKQLLLQSLQKIDLTPFTDQRLVIKGCGDKSLGAYAYLEITRLLRPLAKSIMYGEPCSTVPVYKKR